MPTLDPGACEARTSAARVLCLSPECSFETANSFPSLLGKALAEIDFLPGLEEAGEKLLHSPAKLKINFRLLLEEPDEGTGDRKSSPFSGVFTLRLRTLRKRVMSAEQN